MEHVSKHADPSANALRGRHPRSATADEGFLPPRTPAEELLCRIWGEVLETGPVGVRDDFVRLGGNSLHAVRVIARVMKELEVDLSFARLLDFGTVEQLAAHIDEALWARRATAGPGRTVEGDELEEGVL